MADPTSVALERPATTHGRARVAALLLAMGKPLADKVLKYFDENEIREIAETTATLGSVSRASVDKLVNEISIALEDGADIRGSSSEAQQLLAGIVPPEKLALLMTSLQKSDDKAVWTRLADIPEPTIAQYLLKEHAQVAAVILVRAGTSVAAAVLRHAPAQTRSELVRRILAIRPTTEKAEQLLESALRDELLARAAQGSPPPVHARLADIINKMDPQQMDEVLSDLESRRPKDAKLIKGMLFARTGPSRSVIPGDPDQRFQLIPISDSNGSRSAVPGDPDRAVESVERRDGARW